MLSFIIRLLAFGILVDRNELYYKKMLENYVTTIILYQNYISNIELTVP